ncbi:MAG: Rrf2 family transcriptional regulator [Flavobacteriales bacterium]|jgi:Rrf2 family protein|nr:Rrf2 family transcriptional regulator [Flavobacteriales bacterium]
MFSKSCEYGLRAAIFIAQQSTLKQKVHLNDIASEIDSPSAFTAKILQLLTKQNIVKAIKGPYGGFLIEEQQLEQLLLSDIVDAIDGNQIYTGCGLGLKQCDAKSPCPLHHQFVNIRNELKTMLESTTLKSLANEMHTNLVWLKR